MNNPMHLHVLLASLTSHFFPLSCALEVHQVMCLCFVFGLNMFVDDASNVTNT
jgi:hypothetical protein